MVIIHRVKKIVDNNEVRYAVQQSTFPFLWKSIATFTDKEKAIALKERLNRLSLKII